MDVSTLEVSDEKALIISLLGSKAGVMFPGLSLQECSGRKRGKSKASMRYFSLRDM